jgi:hypothetical protein
MERMQSTWESVVEMDMSESGVRPVSLRELAAIELDLDAILDMPLGGCNRLPYRPRDFGHVELIS